MRRTRDNRDTLPDLNVFCLGTGRLMVDSSTLARRKIVYILVCDKLYFEHSLHFTASTVLGLDIS
jgi:hypothetical protein